MSNALRELKQCLTPGTKQDDRNRQKIINEIGTRAARFFMAKVRIEIWLIFCLDPERN